MAATTETTAPQRPGRSPLVVDLEQGRILADEHQGALPADAPTTDQVLASYLSLVYRMRHATPGSPVPLRDTDLEVLSRALELAVPQVHEKLHDLMVSGTAPATRRSRRPLVLALSGVAVAVVALGSAAVAYTQAQPVPVDVSTTTFDITALVPVELAPAQVVTRDGEQHERQPGE